MVAETSLASDPDPMDVINLLIRGRLQTGDMVVNAFGRRQDVSKRKDVLPYMLGEGEEEPLSATPRFCLVEVRDMESQYKTRASDKKLSPLPPHEEMCRELATNLLGIVGISATSHEMIKDIRVSADGSQFVIEFTEKGVQALKENAFYIKRAEQLIKEDKRKMQFLEENQRDKMDGEVTPEVLKQTIRRLKGNSPGR